MAGDKFCCCSVWCWAISISVVGIIGTVGSLVNDHYSLGTLSSIGSYHFTLTGHLFALRDYVQLTLYGLVIGNVLCCHSVCLWFVLAILQLIDTVVKFAVLVFLAVVVGLNWKETKRCEDGDDGDCRTKLVIVVVVATMIVICDALFTVVLFKCFRAERANRVQSVHQ